MLHVLHLPNNFVELVLTCHFLFLCGPFNVLHQFQNFQCRKNYLDLQGMFRLIDRQKNVLNLYYFVEKV